MTKFFLAILIAVSPGFAIAQSSGENQALSGAGTVSCGNYIEYTKSNEEISSPFTHWAQGFLSGMNLAEYAASKKPFVLLPDSASINAYLDKHCRENPLSTPVEGAITLFRELRTRRDQSVQK